MSAPIDPGSPEEAALAAAQASIRGLIEALNEAQTDRDALAAKIETMLADEEDARALRIAEHASREGVEGKLAGALERITMAAGEIARYGMTDGAHHKQWLLDRVLRLMLTEEQYTTWIAAMNSDPDYTPWDVGIAP